MRNYYAIGLILCLAAVFALSAPALAQTEGEKTDTEAPEARVAPKKAVMAEKESNPLVVFETTKGKLTIELYPDKAPVTVKNFLTYVNEGFYEGTVFHRVIPRFVIQGGGMTADMQRKPTHDPIVNEADNGLKNLRGTLSMARTNDPNSATSQFFINLVDNTALDKSETSAGYAVFGKVIRGLDNVDRIAAVETTTKGQHKDVPVQPITVTKAYVAVDEEKAPQASEQKTIEGKAEESKVMEGKAAENQPAEGAAAKEEAPASADKKAKEQKVTDK